MLMASTLTNVGMFEAEMSSDAWQVAGMAEKGMIPKVFAARSKYVFCYLLYSSSSFFSCF
jgi:hypothetical protein